MFRGLIAGMAALGLSVVAAQAASLQGEAMVNCGEGYKAQVGGALNTGDTVMVRQGGTATIAFADGCAFTLSTGRVFTVSSKSPCADGTQAVRQIDFSGRMGQSGQQQNDDNGAGGFLPPGVGPGVVVLGVGAAVGAGLLIYNATKKDSSP